MGPALEDFWEVETVATLGVPEEEALEEVALDVELPDEFMVGVFPEAEPVDCPDDEVVDFPDEEPVDFALEEVDEDAEFNAGALLQPVFPRPDVSDWACEVCLFASDTKMVKTSPPGMMLVIARVFVVIPVRFDMTPSAWYQVVTTYGVVPPVIVKSTVEQGLEVGLTPSVIPVAGLASLHSEPPCTTT